MKRTPLIVIAILALVLLAQAAVAQDAGAALEQVGQDISSNFWGGIDHVVNVLVDFIGRVLMKIADAVLAVLHGVGIGNSR